jgi:hypothetical protein
MNKKFQLKALMVASLICLGGQSAHADINQNNSVYIQANNDQNNGTGGNTGEGVFISSNYGGSSNTAAGAQFFTGGGAYITGNYTAQLNSVGSSLQANGNNAYIGAVGTTTVYSAGNVLTTSSAGNATMSAYANTYISAGADAYYSATGNTTITSGGNVAVSASGTGSINTTGALTFNTTGSTGNITMGNRSNQVTIQGSTNNIGAGYVSTNNMGTGAASTNNIGTGAASTNNIGSNGASTNNIGTNGASTNNIGTGGTATSNYIGNTQTATLVNAAAGNAAMSLANNSASLTVPSSAPGVNNGVVVDNTRASMTGGSVSPTRLTMNDNAATFSRVSNGAPITVTGVADGRSDYDAVNVRQFAGAVAAVAAQANVPALAAGQDRAVGLGVASFMGKTGLAFGMNIRADADSVYKLSVSSGLNGGGRTVVGGGAAWSF